MSTREPRQLALEVTREGILPELNGARTKLSGNDGKRLRSDVDALSTL